MRALKLMADYQSFPLWESSPGAFGNIDPASLPISAELISRLSEWAEKYDKTLDLDDPMNSGFSSEQVEHAFFEEGRGICHALQSELGEDYKVSYGHGAGS